MKPVPFTYLRAGSVAEACRWLQEDPETRILAGGQTLMPMLAMRLARPTRVVDICRIPELRGIRVEDDSVVIGATTRQHEVASSATVAAELPLLAMAMPWVGHAPTRRQGTIGGSIANADPAAEIALVAVTLRAELEIAEADGRTSRLLADAFFLGPMVTSMPATGLLTAVRFPRRSDRTGMGVAFTETSNRRSDYALAAAAVELTLDPAGRCAALAVGIGGASEVPALLELPGLLGSGLDPADLEAALTPAVAALPLLEDAGASAAYRGRIAVAIAVRTILDARRQALAQPAGKGPMPWN